MAQEDLTLLTEIDPGGFVTVSSNLAAVANATHNLTTPVLFKDKGVGGYNGDFSIDLAFDFGVTSDFPMFLNVSKLFYNDGTYDRPFTANDADVSAGDDCIGFYRFANTFVINSVVAGVRTFGTATLTLNQGQMYYVTFKLVGTVATINVYSDPARSVLVTTRSLAHAASIKRFIAIASDYGAFGGGLWSANFSGLDIGDVPIIANAIPPHVFQRVR